MTCPHPQGIPGWKHRENATRMWKSRAVGLSRWMQISCGKQLATATATATHQTHQKKFLLPRHQPPSPVTWFGFDWKNDVLDGRHNGLLGRGSGFLVEAHLWPPKSCIYLWTVHIYCLEHSPIYELTSIKAMFFSSFQTLASLLQNINQGSGHQCTVGDGDVYQINWKRSYISKVLNWWSWEH